MNFFSYFVSIFIPLFIAKLITQFNVSYGVLVRKDSHLFQMQRLKPKPRNISYWVSRPLPPVAKKAVSPNSIGNWLLLRRMVSVICFFPLTRSKSVD